MISLHSLKTDQRKDLCYSFSYIIEYVLGPHASEEISKGFVVNINNPGLYLFIFQHLAEGLNIITKSISLLLSKSNCTLAQQM